MMLRPAHCHVQQTLRFVRIGRIAFVNDLGNRRNNHRVELTSLCLVNRRDDDFLVPDQEIGLFQLGQLVPVFREDSLERTLVIPIDHICVAEKSLNPLKGMLQR